MNRPVNPASPAAQGVALSSPTAAPSGFTQTAAAPDAASAIARNGTWCASWDRPSTSGVNYPSQAANRRL
jgi:hypothetical protein